MNDNPELASNWKERCPGSRPLDPRRSHFVGDDTLFVSLEKAVDEEATEEAPPRRRLEERTSSGRLFEDAKKRSARQVARQRQREAEEKSKFRKPRTNRAYRGPSKPNPPPAALAPPPVAAAPGPLPHDATSHRYLKPAR